jgi:hypothetical protein
MNAKRYLVSAALLVAAHCCYLAVSRWHAPGLYGIASEVRLESDDEHSHQERNPSGVRIVGPSGDGLKVDVHDDNPAQEHVVDPWRDHHHPEVVN